MWKNPPENNVTIANIAERLAFAGLFFVFFKIIVKDLKDGIQWTGPIH